MRPVVRRLEDLRSVDGTWRDFVQLWVGVHTTWGEAEEHWLGYADEVVELKELAHLTNASLLARVEVLTQNILMLQLRRGTRCKFCPVSLKFKKIPVLGWRRR